MTGKSSDLVRRFAEILLTRLTEPDPANQPLLRKYLNLFIDPHGTRAMELLAHIEDWAVDRDAVLRMISEGYPNSREEP